MESVTQERPATPAPVRSEPAPDSSPSSIPKTGGLREWFTHWSIERRVLTGFGLVFTGIVVISAISYRNTAVLIENSRLDTKSHELVQLLGSVGEALGAAESGHRRYLVTGDESYLTSYRTVVKQMPEYLRYLRGLTSEEAEQQARVATLEQLIASQLGAEAGAIAQREKHGYEAVRHLALSGAAKNELEGIQRLMTELDSAEQRVIRGAIRWKYERYDRLAWTRRFITAGPLGLRILSDPSRCHRATPRGHGVAEPGRAAPGRQ
jgi:CHASE3 domain sensor protein